MANNEQNIKRVAFGNFTVPATANVAGNTASVLSFTVNGAFIPKGAIVTGIKYFPGGAITNGSNMKNGTVNLLAGGQALGTADLVASAAFVQTVLANQVLQATKGVYVTVGGPLLVNIASSDSARTGVAFDADVYVEYLYCGSRDQA